MEGRGRGFSVPHPLFTPFDHWVNINKRVRPCLRLKDFFNSWNLIKVHLQDGYKKSRKKRRPLAVVVVVFVLVHLVVVAFVVVVDVSAQIVKGQNK